MKIWGKRRASKGKKRESIEQKRWEIKEMKDRRMK